jgi:hypothetical protein
MSSTTTCPSKDESEAKAAMEQAQKRKLVEAQCEEIDYRRREQSENACRLRKIYQGGRKRFLRVRSFLQERMKKGFMN